MSEMRAVYEGELVVRCRMANGAEMATFPPGILKGVEKGLFSPTDLFAASLGMCVLTMMGIKAERLGVDLLGAEAVVEKEMQGRPPFEAKRLGVVVRCGAGFEEGIRTQLEQAGRECPVKHSLHPSVEVDIRFEWGV